MYRLFTSLLTIFHFHVIPSPSSKIVISLSPFHSFISGWTSSVWEGKTFVFDASSPVRPPCHLRPGTPSPPSPPRPSTLRYLTEKASSASLWPLPSNATRQPAPSALPGSREQPAATRGVQNRLPSVQRDADERRRRLCRGRGHAQDTFTGQARELSMIERRTQMLHSGEYEWKSNISPSQHRKSTSLNGSVTLSNHFACLYESASQSSSL